MRDIRSGDGSADDNIPVQVLLAEDEFLIRYDLAESIRELGWHVYEVASADEGLSIIRQGIHIDLLVSDVNMPGDADGVDLAVEVRRALPQARIMLMSGMMRASTLPPTLDLFSPKPVVRIKELLSDLMSKVAPTR